MSNTGVPTVIVTDTVADARYARIAITFGALRAMREEMIATVSAYNINYAPVHMLTALRSRHQSGTRRRWRCAPSSI